MKTGKSLGLAAIAVALLAPLAAHAAVQAAGTGGGFDVAQATRLWLDTLQGPARERSDAYFEGGYWLPIWGAMISVAIDLLVLRFRLSALFRDIGVKLFRRPGLVVAVTALLYSLVGTVVTLPWTIYTGYFREKQYGLMNMSFGGWLGEQAIGFALSLVMMTLLVVVIYAVIRRFPKNWWLVATGVIGVFVLFIMALFPVYVSPLFNTYTEMPEGPLRTRIVAMAQAHDVPAAHIYVFDASKQTKRISANVSGLGPTIRISLNDNLLNRSTPDEVAAVMGHELGHYVLGHIWRNIIIVSALAALMLFIASRVAPALIRRHGKAWGVHELADPASLPVLGICMAVLGLLASPLMNTLIRVDESEADAFGLEAAREPDAFASVAMKLSEYRKIEPGPVEEALFFDHPSGKTRVTMAMQWKKDNVANPIMVHPAPLPQTFGKD